MRYVFHTAFVTCDKKTFWPKNEAYFWHREGTSFKTGKVGIFISKCFKSRFRVETWTPVGRLILITCELLSRVTQCCVVMFTFLKNWLMFAGTEILLWQYWKCGGSFHSFLTCFAVADMLHSPCYFGILSLPCTFCASVPIWSLHSTWGSAASLKDWQVPGK